MFFVQTKIDQASETQWNSWRDRNLSILSESLGLAKERIPYFPVSSKLKYRADQRKDGQDLNDSGFLHVIQLLHKVLLPRKDALITGQAIRALHAEIAKDGKNVADLLVIASETSKERLADYRAKLGEAQQEMKEWESQSWRKLVREFQDYIGRLKRDTVNTIQDSFDADSFAPFLEQAKSECRSAREIYDNAGPLVDSYAGQCSQKGTAVLEEFAKAYDKAFTEALQQGAVELQGLLAEKISVAAAELGSGGSSNLDALRTAFFNFSFISTLAGGAAYGVGYLAGVAMAASVIAPPVAIVIAVGAGVAALATSIWAAIKGWRGTRENQFQVALMKFENALKTVAQKALKATTRSFNDLAAELDTKTRDALEDFVSSARSELSKRVKEATDALNRSEREAEAAVADLSRRLKPLTELAKEAKEVEALVATALKA